MMRINLSLVFALFALCCSACSDNEDIRIQYNKDGSVEISPKKIDGIVFDIHNAHIKAIVQDSLLPKDHPTFNFILSGKSKNGSFTVKSQDSIIVTLDGISLNSKKGAPLWFKTQSGSALVVNDGTENDLTLVEVKDTAKQKSAVLFTKSDLTISGKGKLALTATADGCKGINSKGNLRISDLDLAVSTTGDNLGPDTISRMGPPPGFDGQMPEDFDPENMPEEVKAFIEQMQKEGKTPEDFHHGGPGPQGPPPGMHPGGHGDFPQGDMQRPEGPDSFPGGPDDFGGDFPPGGGPGGDFPGGDFGGKQKFLGTCKGIKALGQITIESGNITVTTVSRGAEGIEGKKGVTINGGVVFVKAMDDAINSNGKIIFNGGETTAWSMGNDAIDANGRENGAITISGGKVYGYCQQGAPEEGFDCDFSPIVITGGTAFGIGQGMGDMPSSPSEKTSKQPSILFLGLNMAEGEKVELYKASDTKSPLVTIVEKLPFSFNGSSSLFTSPELKLGEEYVLKIGNVETRFVLSKNFQTVGEPQFPMGPGGMGGPQGGFPGPPRR